MKLEILLNVKLVTVISAEGLRSCHAAQSSLGSGMDFQASCQAVLSSSSVAMHRAHLPTGAPSALKFNLEQRLARQLSDLH